MKKKFLLSLLVVLSLFLVVGCGSKNESSSKNEKNNVDEVIDKIDNSNNSDDETSSTSDDIELYSDDKQIVFANQNIKLVFTYEGDTITGYYEYIEYPSRDLAKQAYEALKYADKNDEDGNTIKNYTLKGAYLVVEYEDSEFDGTTLEDIKRLYSYLDEVQKND